MTTELFGMLWIAVPVLTLFVVAELLYRRFRVDAELTRKVTHLGSGVVVFFMPWALHSHWSVLALASGFALLLGGTRAMGWGRGTWAVSRGPGP